MKKRSSPGSSGSGKAPRPKATTPRPKKKALPTRLGDYAKLMREVRSRQPKVSSEEAYDQARRVLTAAGQPTTPRPTPATPPPTPPPADDSNSPGSATGPGNTAD